MRKKYLATALVGLAFFGLVPSASAGHRHLAEEYADRVQRERQERIQEESRAVRLREQAELRRRAEEERRTVVQQEVMEDDWQDDETVEEERQDEENKIQEQPEDRIETEKERLRMEREQEEKAAREREWRAAEAREAERKAAEARERALQAAEEEAREKKRQAVETEAREAAEETVRRMEEEKRRAKSETAAEEAEGTGEGLLRRLMRRAQEKINGAGMLTTDSAQAFLHTTEPQPMKLLSAETINTGGTLIFSDSPEYLKRPGILYADIVKGDARVFYYHLNDTKQKLKVAVVLESVGGQYAVVRVTRRAVSDPDQMYTKVGKSVQQEFFSDSQQTDRLYIGPDERRLLLEKPDKTVLQPGELISGMADFTASAPVRVTVLCYPSGKDPLKYVEEAELLPSDEHKLRGTFVGMDRILRVEKYNPEKDGVACVMVADGVRDKFCEGVDATDGSLVTNEGNYGVLYRIEAHSKNKARFFISPMGGGFAGAVRVEAGAAGTRIVSVPEGKISFGERSVHPPFDKDGMTTLLPSVELSSLGDYRAKPPVFFEMSPPGASNLPVLFILAPEDIKLSESAP